MGTAGVFWQRSKSIIQTALYFIAFSPPLLLVILLGCIFGIVRPILGLILRYKYGERISFLGGLDAMFAIDCHVEPMNVTAVFVLKGEPNVVRVRNTACRMVEARGKDGKYMYPQLRQYLREDLGYFFWLKEREFSVDDHVKKYEGAMPKTEQELNQIIGQLCNRKSPPGKSPWQFIVIPLVDNFPGCQPGPHYCVVQSFQHAMADGVSLVRIITSHLFDEPFDEKSPIPHYSGGNVFFTSILLIIRILFQLPRAMYKQVMDHDSNALHGKRLTGKKMVGFSAPIDLERIQRVRRATRTTINDVVMACVGGALNSYFTTVGAPSPLRVTGVIPVAKHDFNENPQFKNGSAFVPYIFPTYDTDPHKRLKDATKEMDHVKTSANMWFNLYGFRFLINRLPSCMTRMYLNSLHLTCIVSNVPGCKKGYSMCGNDIIERIGFFLPNRGWTGLGISILSYNTKVEVGVIVDKALVNREDAVDVILTSFTKELEILEKSTVSL